MNGGSNPHEWAGGREPALIISADEDSRENLVAVLRECDLEAVWCGSLQDAREQLRATPFRAILCNRDISDGSYFALVREVKKVRTPAPVIVLSRKKDWTEYLKTLQAGAFDCIASPPERLEADRVLRNALEETRRQRFNSSQFR